MSGHLVLAGGGHSHALVLRRWAMHPQHRPPGLITLVNRSSQALYSGMVPGLIAGIYRPDQISIDLRQLADQAGVALVIDEIEGLDWPQRMLRLAGRPPLPFTQLSLDVGCVTRPDSTPLQPIKPLEPALQFLEQQDHESQQAIPFHVVGGGLAGVETILALRRRWPRRPLTLWAREGSPPPPLRKALISAGIASQTTPGTQDAPPGGPGLLCTGSRAPSWLTQAGLPVDEQGRVRTARTLEVLDHPGLFASGDCGVIASDPRPASGVWAVRAARPLARNLEALSRGKGLQTWRPQQRALQLLGSGRHSNGNTAWALWGKLLIGPHPWLWRWKQALDHRFMAMFKRQAMTQTGKPTTAMLCRGCAAKLPAAPLEAALRAAGLETLGTAPEDAAPLPGLKGREGQPVLQSVDGFPALISDPWLNGRLTALHASSDLWACGAQVQSAQAVITLPQADPTVQQVLLSQTLAGIRSALDPQGARLIGGHTLEAREPGPSPLSLGVQVALSVNGTPAAALWPKAGLQAGDQLLLSRRLGTGVLFAAAMAGAAAAASLDTALAQMATSQHPLLLQLQELEKHHPGGLHAATDITGFGLLGHLGEMLPHQGLRVLLHGEQIPTLPNALALLAAGHASSLAPANRRAWHLLDPQGRHPARVELRLETIAAGSTDHQALLELLVDPQTCGPLLISVSPHFAEHLHQAMPNQWTAIGNAQAG